MAREEPRSVILTVLIEGTSMSISPPRTMIGVFAEMSVQATPLSAEPLPQPPTAPGHYKLAFSGCGVTNGFWGVIYAVGLKDQCKVIRHYVEAFLKAGNTVAINFVGQSRGGIAGVYLAHELACFQKAQVVLNLLLFDPVPGDPIWFSRYLDFGSVLNSNWAMDVSQVGNIGNVLLLYPYEPLPAIALHSPIIPDFPETCKLEKDVILGMHQGALFVTRQPETCLAFWRIRKFLMQNGTRLDRSPFRGNLDVEEATLERWLQEELKQALPSSRALHSTRWGEAIVRYTQGNYLCRSHEALARGLGLPEVAPVPGVPQYMLDVADASKDMCPC